jgi:hypothetical protein
MPKYRAKVKCFVDNSLREVGDVFEYNGPLNTNLERVGPVPDQVEEDTPEPSPVVRRPGRPRKTAITERVD